MATGLPCSTVRWDNNWVSQASLDTATAAAIYEALWLGKNIQSWPRLFNSDKLPAHVENMFLNFFGGSFVIGFELPPYLTSFLDRHGIGYVDCSVSPVRFMDDLLFEVSAYSRDVTEAIRRYQVPEGLIRLQAGVVSSNVAKSNPRPPRPNSLLLILQTSFDKVVIENGSFATMTDHLERVLELAKEYDHVMIKEHPLESQAKVVAKLQKSLPSSQVTAENFYRLVGHGNLRGVAALSSSCVLEAKYFGKKGHYVLPGFSHDKLSVGLEGINIDDAVIMPDFWRDVLKPSGCPVTPKDGLRLPPKPNRFRQQLRTAWGFNQIDTDIAVGWAR